MKEIDVNLQPQPLQQWRNTFYTVIVQSVLLILL